ncbi:MAG TPA: DUF3562 domain-containing protein [Steroidobacteraceae bacterium]|nr:DUF3562 domain-containing protein [Steroidobacteraceae bacterium]
MSVAAPSIRVLSPSGERTVAALAGQTDVAREVVRHLYEEEAAALLERATVRNFIEVIAGRRVKQRLRALKHAARARTPGGAPR